MFKRTLSGKLSALAKKFPVVSIMGPRQSGKTTLSKKVFEDHDYVSLEEPDEREFALADPKGFLRRFSGGVILDAVQRFVRLCAGRTGQLLNLSSLASDCGISHTTARHWISILQAGFIIQLLP